VQTFSNRRQKRPTVSISAAPPSTTTDTSASISFTTQWATTVMCRLDGGAFTVCTSPARYSGLPVGTHVFTVRASNAVGSATASATWTIQTAAPPPPPPSGPSYAVRGMYTMATPNIDAEAAVGVNAFGIAADDYTLLNSLAARGMKAWVHPGWYLNSTCSFTWSDDQVRQVVPKIAGGGAVLTYYIADEPDVTRCPNAPQQLAARSALIHSLAPGSQTMLANWHQLPDFAHAVDTFALDMYPCSVPWYGGCALHYVTDLAAQADSLGLRYYGVVQAFGDAAGFTLPSATQLHDIFNTWRATHMVGYFVFAWDWPQSDPSYWLANHPDLLSQLQVENAR
jgi:hypothetical protein